MDRSNNCFHVLIVPGIGNSGPNHWQTLWEQNDPRFKRVEQDNWEIPVCSHWVEALDMAISGTSPKIVVVAHSLGCLTVAHWAAAKRTTTIQGAMLVAPPNPRRPDFPKQAQGFSPVPLVRLPFPSVIVASSNDPFGDLAFAQNCAVAWGGRFVNIGAKGHINADSRLGNWEEGLQILQSLLR